MIEKFLKQNSFHDGYITSMKYCKEQECVKMNIVQLYSEINIEHLVEISFEEDDLVEIELNIGNVFYVSSMDSDYNDYEIVEVMYQQKEDEDILLYKLHMFGGYKEICIKGKKIRISAKINKKANI